MIDNYFVYFFVFVFFVLTCSMGFILPMVIEEISRARDRQKFRVALSSSLASNSLSWKQVRLLADRYKLSQRDLANCLIRLVADSIENKGNLDFDKLTKFEQYYDQVQKDEPFEGIPNDVRFHLERVREKLGDSDELLRPLAKQLQDLSVRSRAKERNNMIVSLLGLIVGFVGAIFGAMPLLEQSKQAPSNIPQPVIAKEHNGASAGSRK